MKNLKLLVLLLTVSVFSFSCGDDDDGGSGGVSGDSVLVFGDDEFQLRAGVIEDYGEYSDGIYNFDIILLDSPISEFDGEFFPTNQTFSGVYFELFTDNPLNLEVGTYTFGNEVEVGSYEYADIYIESTLENFNFFEITSGTFKVLDNGSTYELEFEGTTSDGTSFSGYYKGSLQEYDDSSDRNSTSNSRRKNGFFGNSRR